jgi:hypothetical protein
MAPLVVGRVRELDTSMVHLGMAAAVCTAVCNGDLTENELCIETRSTCIAHAAVRSFLNSRCLDHCLSKATVTVDHLCMAEPVSGTALLVMRMHTILVTAFQYGGPRLRFLDFSDFQPAPSHKASCFTRLILQKQPASFTEQSTFAEVVIRAAQQASPR